MGKNERQYNISTDLFLRLNPELFVRFLAAGVFVLLLLSNLNTYMVIFLYNVTLSPFF